MRHLISWLVGFLLFSLSAHSNARPEAAAPDRGEPRLPALPDYARPASAALDINAALRQLYADATARKPDTAGQVRRLIDQLKALEKLDSFIERLGPGLGDKEIRNDALRYRALAWLHGWVTLGELAEQTSCPGADGPRACLVGLGDDGALGLLLRIYARMRKAEGDKDEPLWERLDEGTHLVFLLGYRESWQEGEPRGRIRHRYYIPSAQDLIGKPCNRPERNKRRLMTLWALVNLQLDTWHKLGVDSFTVPRSPDAAARSDRPLALKDLADWLSAFHANEDVKKSLQAFDQKNGSCGTGLGARADNLAKFLSFREKYSDEGELEKLLNQLAERRVPPITPKKDDLFDGLVKAAKPIDGERLYDAGIWLRYVLLLSYRTQRPVLFEEKEPVKEAPPYLEAVWKKLEVGADFKYDRAAPQDNQRAFLRWNREPDDGHASAILADLTRAGLAFLECERDVRGLEEKRFAAAGASTPDAGRAYAAALNAKRTPLQTTFDRCLVPYFPTRPGESPQWGDPVAVSRPEGERARSFRKSATTREQERLAADLAALAGECDTALRLHELVADAYQADNPEEVNTALRLLGGLNGLSNWNVHALPRKPFKQYHDDLTTQIANLQAEIEKTNVAQTLRDNFEDRQKRLAIAQEDLAAAQLGREIASKAIRLNETYQKIAELETEIDELGVRIANLEKQARQNQRQAAGVRLAAATRLRDLVAARVAALGLAVKEAKALADEAGKELDKLAESFDKAAKQIKDERERSRAFGILKAIVSVVGAALAPFTGGASLAVASIVNTGIDIYKKIDETDWKEFGSAVQAIGAIAEQAGGAAELGLRQLGGAKGKELLGKAQDYLKATRDKVKEVEKEVKPLLDAVNSLRNADASRFASALANGFPLSSPDGMSFKIDFGPRKVVLPKGVQKALKTILDSGGHILNDAEARGRDLMKLPELADTELGEKLKKSLAGAVRELPDDIRKKLAGDAATATDRINKAKKDLLDKVGTLKEEERRLLASAVASGLLFTKDGEVVVALSRPIEKEAKQLRERINAVARKEFRDAITGAEKQFNDLREKLRVQGQKLIDKKNDQDLNKLATSIRTNITSMKTEVIQKIQDQLNAAELQLQDTKDMEQVATFEAEAAALFAAASVVRVDQAERRARRAHLGLVAARQSLEISQLGDEKAARQVKAARLALELAETDLRRVYQACLNRGINPRIKEAKPASVGAARFRGLLAGDRADDRERVVIDRLASDVVGMIQWVHLLRFSPGRDESKDPVKLYLRLIQAVSSRQKASAVAKNLESIATKLDELYSTEAVKRIEIEPATGKIPFNRVTWLDRVSAIESRRLEELFPVGSRRESLLGAFRFRLTTDRPDDDHIHEFAGFDISTEGDRYDHYIDLSEIYLVSESQQLSFLILPPLTSAQNTAWFRRPGQGNKEDSVLDRKLERVLNSDFDRITASRILEKHDLWKNRLELTEGLGDWTVFIFANGIKDKALRGVVIEILEKSKFEVGVKMFYLKVKRG